MRGLMSEIDSPTLLWILQNFLGVTGGQYRFVAV